MRTKEWFMAKVLLVIIMSIEIIYSLALFFYDTNLFSVDSFYDVEISNRKNYNYGWGIKYKEGFEVWQLVENIHKGFSENIVYPKYPRK